MTFEWQISSIIIPLYFRRCISDGVGEGMEAVRNFKQWKYVGRVTSQLWKQSYIIILLHQRFPCTFFLFQSNHLQSPDKAYRNRSEV